MNLFEHKELIDDKPMHIATINIENNPNLWSIQNSIATNSNI